MIAILLIIAILVGVFIIFEPKLDYIKSEFHTYKVIWVTWNNQRKYIMLWKMKQ